MADIIELLSGDRIGLISQVLLKAEIILPEFIFAFLRTHFAVILIIFIKEMFLWLKSPTVLPH
jgi:hypothetical protein